MKMYGDYQNAAALMLPGVVTRDGFLGDDTRPLVDIIQVDEEAFGKLGLEWDVVAARLQYFREQADQGLGGAVAVDKLWLVRNIEARGNLPCPFGDKLLGKATTVLTLQNSGEQITYSELSLHLLAEHHFLQGQGAPFRLEPVMLKKILFI